MKIFIFWGMSCSLQKDILEDSAASTFRIEQNPCRKTRVIYGKELGLQTGQLETVAPKEGGGKCLRAKEVRKNVSRRT
jgi:hypothetical protein